MKEKDKKNIPNHVGIIMSGNRSWAKERNLPFSDGYFKGYEKIKEIPELFFAKGIKIVSIFVFSVEDWDKPMDEINYLMKSLKKILKDDIDEINDKGYKILISGRINELPGDLPEICAEVKNITSKNNKGILNICFNYGGRAEVVDAVRKIVKNKIELEQIHEGIIKKYLYNYELGDIDIIIKTSGKMHLSGFQLWQSSYSELLFLKKDWPDFEERDVELVLKEYILRKEITSKY